MFSLSPAVFFVEDDSGYWGSGGLFTAINNRSKIPGEQYELAAKVKGENIYPIRGSPNIFKITSEAFRFRGLNLVTFHHF